jgi:hypothetical protein
LLFPKLKLVLAGKCNSESSVHPFFECISHSTQFVDSVPPYKITLVVIKICYFTGIPCFIFILHLAFEPRQ